MKVFQVQDLSCKYLLDKMPGKSDDDQTYISDQLLLYTRKIKVFLPDLFKEGKLGHLIFKKENTVLLCLGMLLLDYLCLDLIVKSTWNL